MNVTGIIAEYNPFHLGHVYHLTEARRLTAADFVVVIMSGDFVQRGEPALMDKYLRAQMALLDGADMVLELPVPFATAGGEDFAGGAVALLDKLGVVNSLVFGSESGNLEDILSAAELLEHESPETAEDIRRGLKEGLSYPRAVSRAVLSARNQTVSGLFDNSCRNRPFCADDATLAQILFSPNNLLGVEYCRALNRRSSGIRPFTLKRLGDYHGRELSVSAHAATTMDNAARSESRSYSEAASSRLRFASASAIRQTFMVHEPTEAVKLIRDSVSEQTLSLLKKEAGTSYPLFMNDFSDALFYRLLSESEESLCQYVDMTPDLAGRILKLLPGCRNYSELAEAVKCKSYTRLRINRALLHCLLGITTEKMAAFKQNDYANYVRVLGFKESAAPLLQEINRHASIPLLLRMKEDSQQLTGTDRMLLSLNDFSANIYRMTAQHKYGCTLPEEYRRRLLRV